MRAIRNWLGAGWLAAAIVTMAGGRTAPAAPAPTAPNGMRATSVTLAQAVARQDANYARMQRGRGGVVWREDTPDTATGAWKATTRAILFAFEGRRSVNLVVRHEDGKPLPAWGDKPDWSRFLAGSLIDNDVVSQVLFPRNANRPQVKRVPYNPAVHENNPLVAFQPRLLGDERTRLKDLLAALPKLPVRPTIAEFDTVDGLRLRVDFANPAGTEFVYYILNPAKACLAEEVGRVAGGKYVTRTRILIGGTSDGLWIPARRERMVFDTQGRAVLREYWYYDSYESNGPLPARGLTLDFFSLPAEMRMPTNQRQSNAPPSGGD